MILRLDHKAGFRDRRAKIDSGRVVELDIHGSFRGYCFNACGFKSRPAHQKKWNFNIQLRRHGRSISLSAEEENSIVVAQPIWIGV